MVDESIRTGQEPVAASGVMTPAGALQALAGGAPGAITVAGTAQEVSAHFGDLAVAAGAGSIASIAVTDNAPLTVAAVKRIAVEILKDPDARDLARCEDMVAACFASDDYKEGRAAFLEKRKPRFRGC